MPSPPEIVAGMLDMAELQAGDSLLDLGCGDGRIVLAAAARGYRARGVDLDPRLIERCRASTREAGMTDRASFEVGNFFDTDLTQADVITLYLLTSINRTLRQKLQSLRPGTRIISHSFDMGDWQPDETRTVDTKVLFRWTVGQGASP